MYQHNVISEKQLYARPRIPKGNGAFTGHSGEGTSSRSNNQRTRYKTLLRRATGATHSMDNATQQESSYTLQLDSRANLASNFSTSTPAPQPVPAARQIPVSSNTSTVLLSPSAANQTVAKKPEVIAPATKDSIYHPDEAHLRMLHLILIVFGALFATSIILFVALYIRKRNKGRKQRLSKEPVPRQGMSPDKDFDQTTVSSSISYGKSPVYSMAQEFPVPHDRSVDVTRYNTRAVVMSLNEEEHSMKALEYQKISPHTSRFSHLAAATSEAPSQFDVGSIAPSEYLHRNASEDCGSTVVADDSISVVLGRLEHQKYKELLGNRR